MKKADCGIWPFFTWLAKWSFWSSDVNEGCDPSRLSLRRSIFSTLINLSGLVSLWMPVSPKAAGSTISVSSTSCCVPGLLYPCGLTCFDSLYSTSAAGCVSSNSYVYWGLRSLSILCSPTCIVSSKMDSLASDFLAESLIWCCSCSSRSLWKFLCFDYVIFIGGLKPPRFLLIYYLLLSSCSNVVLSS